MDFPLSPKLLEMKEAFRSFIDDTVDRLGPNRKSLKNMKAIQV